MSDTTPGERASRRAAATRHTRRRRIVVGVGVVALVLVAGLGFAWWRLEGNISRLDVSEDLGERPEVAEGPLNILLIGSDTREDQGVPGASLSSGARSDTTLIAHVSADREHVTVVSVPRDSMVPAPPNCDSSVPKEQWTDTQWNSTFSVGGPACLIQTIEGNTGLFINHFAVVDFRGFRGMVDALGGVPVCTPEAIDDDKAKLKLSAGRHVLDGDQALGYVRARKTLGDGSDLGRIKRQQAFLSSVVQEATRTSLLLRPDKLFGFLNAATQSLTTDEEFSLGTMQDLATSVKGIGIKNIQFITVPVKDYEPDPNRVAWAPEAEDLWQTLLDDDVVGEKPTPSRLRVGGAAHREPDRHHRRGRQRHRGAGSGRRGGRRARAPGLPRGHDRQLAGAPERRRRRARHRSGGGSPHRGGRLRGRQGPRQRRPRRHRARDARRGGAAGAGDPQPHRVLAAADPVGDRTQPVAAAEHRGPHGGPGHLRLSLSLPGHLSQGGGGGGSRGVRGFVPHPARPFPASRRPANRKRPAAAGRFGWAEAEGFEPSMGG